MANRQLRRRRGGCSSAPRSRGRVGEIVAEGLEDHQHQADDHQVHADVEGERRRHVHVAEHRQVEVDGCAPSAPVADQQRARRRSRRRRRSPAPRIVHGLTGVSGARRRCRRRRSAARSQRRRRDRRRNRRPGWLWPANRRYSDATSTTWNTARTDTSTIRRSRAVTRGPRRRRARIAAACGPTPGQGDSADRRRREHGDLAQGVEAAEVDEDHVDHVVAVARRAPTARSSRGHRLRRA